MVGTDLATHLFKFHEDYTQKQGYSGVLKQMALSANQLSSNPNNLTPGQVKELQNKLNFWKKKLNL